MVELRLFRLVAIAEALSWAGLLVGMFFKYILVTGELGVKIFGPVHGGLFLLYVAAVISAARTHGWSRGTIVLGLACGVPPFASVWFERRMSRRAVEVAPEAV
ncbi:integral membrane protein [Nonomuraea polychroma]|uniref:Integral membrane protein n=1 Tax=Nonomuraea polychroma TaxID=46176 RepID=A0A438M7H4_9ACTN|nr:integral membrane protein [Nonomuraea polychroma]